MQSSVEALAFGMAWHYALDVRSEARQAISVMKTVLRNYRRLFGSTGLDELLVRCLTPDRLGTAGVSTVRYQPANGMDSRALRWRCGR